MIVRWLTATQYRRGLRQVEAGDLDAVLAQFHPTCRLTFAGDTPLGANGLSGPDLRCWFERFLRLLPGPRFEIQRLVIAGPPWRTRLAAHVLIRSTIDGRPYENEFGHFLTIRWARVTEDIVIEDTQRWDRACRRLVAAGSAEAGAPPIGQPRSSNGEA